MRIILFVLAIILNVSAMGQNAFKVVKDSVDGGLIYNGQITFENLARERTFTWYQKGVNDYQPDERVMTMLKFYLKQYKLIIFLGTWCDDSHNLIPKLEKVLQLTHYPDATLTMYGVDRAKNTIGYETKRYEIVNVPTIILMKNDLETGRITETVKTSIEADLAAIIEKDMSGQEPQH